MAAANRRGALRGLLEWTKIGVPALVVIAAGFIFAWQFVEPPPPDRIVIATASPEGSYYRFAQRYRDILAAEHVTLDIKVTKGSVENLQLLRDPAAGVPVAFVQGGVAGPDPSDGLVSLGSLYFEPLWVFYRGLFSVDRLTELKGRRIAIGPEGSGTRALAFRLLEDNGLTGNDTTLLPLGGSEAAQALSEGRIDAAFFVTSVQSDTVRGLLKADGVRLMNFDRGDAYTRLYRYLSHITLPRGAVSLAEDVPSRPVTLLAPTANLVARDDLHPALIPLLLRAATRTHSSGGLLEDPGQFPSTRFVEFPINEDAKRYIEKGPSFLYRYLPFWIANVTDRLAVMLIPLLTLLIPLFRILPPTYRWRIRRRIVRWYNDLRALESEINDSADAAAAGDWWKELKRIEEEVSNVAVPLSYADALYTLRLHVELVRTRLQRIAPEPAGA